jgi:Zn-finger nucleic acid-binding protein
MTFTACPQCRTPLVPDARWRIPVEACPSCGGLWFQPSDLGPFLQHASKTRPAPLQRSPSPTIPSLSCPRCSDITLRSVYAVGGARIQVCGQCQGAWIDLVEQRKIRPRPRATIAPEPMIDTGFHTSDLIEALLDMFS